MTSRLLHASTGLVLLLTACDLPHECFDLVYDEASNRCRCPAGTMPNYELDRCEGPDGEVIPWTNIDPSLLPHAEISDAGTDLGADQGLDARADAGDDASAPDAQMDAGSDAGMAPPNVFARFPWNGFYTGSVHVTDGATVVDHPLRPKFMWETVDGIDHYQLQLTRECSTEDFRDCAFSATELDEITTETTFRPEISLPVERTVPVGNRYFWRVRACVTTVDVAACSDWSEVRYLNVGRQQNDYNGDGYADLVVGAPGQDGGSGYTFIYLGRSTGVATSDDLRLANPVARPGAFGTSVSAGDVNGDGFADLVVSAPQQNSNTGMVYIYLGDVAGPSTSPSITFNSPSGQAQGRFGDDLNSAGDFDADGYDDIVVGAPLMDAPEENEGNAYLFLGGAMGPSSLPNVSFDNPEDEAGGHFGHSVNAALDLNGDGFVDLVVGAPLQGRAGKTYIYQGRPSLTTTPRMVLVDPVIWSNTQFGFATAAGDSNADGFADLFVGASHGSPPGPGTIGEGRGYVFLGASDWPQAEPSMSIDAPSAINLGNFGASASSTDMNGDGFDDFIIGESGVRGSGTTVAAGTAWIFAGGAPPAALPALRWNNPAPYAFARFGTMSAVGDVNGDGYGDVAIGAPGQSAPEMNEGNAFVYQGAASFTAAPSWSLDNPWDQVDGLFGTSLN